MLRGGALRQDAGNHFGGRVVAPERRAHLHAFHHGAHRLQHLLRDHDSLAARGLGRVGLRHAQHDLFRHGHAQIVLHEFGIAQAGQRPDAGDHRNAESFDATEELLQQAQVEDRLRDGVLAARLDLVLEAAQLMFDVGHAGIGRDADGEVGGGPDGIGADVEPVIQPVHDVDQADRVDVEDRGGIGVVAQLGRVAGEAQDVMQPDRRSSQQVRLDAEDVAVAAGVVQNGFDAGVLLDLDAQALRAHAGRGARRVGHVDGVHAELRQQARALDLLGAIDAPRRNDLHQRDKSALGDQRADPRPLREGSGGVSVDNSALAPPSATRVCASMARMAERMARM